MPILNWLNKDEAVTTSKKCTYRLLEEVPELSYGDADNENLLIQGDNLEALKALIPYYAGKVKCIFIDPPYNTKSAFEHYDDNLEHSKWLSLLYPRLELLRELLSEEGSIWITIDDNESHYLKVVCDEIFGRSNFVANCIWQKVYTIKNSAKYFSEMHDHCLVYAKNKPNWHINSLPRTDKQNKAYKNPDNDPRGPWKATPIQARNYYSKGLYEITSPSGRTIVGPPKGTYWRISQESFKALDADNRIWWGKDGNNTPAQKRFLAEIEGGVVPSTMWFYDEAGHNAEAKNEIREVFKEIEDELFITPKPERLIKRVLELSTKEGDLVLDSFLGSGTTIAVAQKMNRQFIGIEIGTHAQNMCRHRQVKVINGDDCGISEALEWKGGGGFRFYKLGEAVFDEYGCLNTDIKFPTLASHIWYLETKTPLGNKVDTPLLGVHNDTAYYLLYNGILGDRRPAGGNVLTSKVLNNLPDIDKHERIVIYGESSRLGEARLKQANITFKQIPYDVGTL
ncbi:site-specific DNA-methyltransferase [Vibrio parahaemolyticus]|nr:site-specific DNA-methyltransferase [Vibrio parahaemolyticus]EME0135588.1 site-specific DNA-methyltransferase [Vibrio parahaemolyticus]HCH0928266.1 site-specific DNA-methyltransferase [Vibrio parahaemolyticus]